MRQCFDRALRNLGINLEINRAEGRRFGWKRKPSPKKEFYAMKRINHTKLAMVELADRHHYLNSIHLMCLSVRINDE